MNENRELILRIEEAEQATISALNEIIQAYNLPFFLFEPIIDKVHRRLLDGRKDELVAARQREYANSKQAEQSESVQEGHRE